MTRIDPNQIRRLIVVKSHDTDDAILSALRDAGFEVSACYSAEEAESQLRSQEHAAAILDLQQGSCLVDPDRERLGRMRYSHQMQTAIIRLATSDQLAHGEFADACQIITEEAAQALHVDRASVWMLSADHSELRCVDLYEQKANRHSDGLFLRADECKRYFDALAKGRAIGAHDACTDPRTSEFKDNYLVPLGITSMLDAVIRVSGKLVGVVCNEHVGDPRTWTEDEIAFAGEVADQAAQAIMNTERRRAESAQRRLEDQLRHSQKMDAVGQLAGGVAHDFNNLLTVILGNVEYVIEQMVKPGGDRTEILPALEQVGHAGKRASSLTRQLLAFSRQQQSQPKVIDLNNILTSMEGVLSRLAGENVRFKVDMASNLDAIRADPGQIEQVVMNLALNARDALDNGGDLILRTENVNRGDGDVPNPENGSGRFVKLEVEDTGRGMDKNMLEHIFEPFYTTKPVGRGTGLGLSTVYGIVKHAGGHTEVESQPGVGTRFCVFLPAVNEQAESESESAEHIEDGTGTILICEDDEPVRKVTSRMLTSHGFSVISTSCAEEAMALAESHKGKIDLLLTDVVMPDLNGAVLAQRMKRHFPTIRVLFMSGYTPDVVVAETMKEHDCRLVEKPFKSAELLEAIRQVLRKQPLA